jgi:hypothetical protein
MATWDSAECPCSSEGKENVGNLKVVGQVSQASWKVSLLLPAYVQ